jgi:hypothetical protein
MISATEKCTKNPGRKYMKMLIGTSSGWQDYGIIGFLGGVSAAFTFLYFLNVPNYFYN